MANAGKIGIGAGAIILGFYLLTKFTSEIGAVIVGIGLISFGIYLIAK